MICNQFQNSMLDKFAFIPFCIVLPFFRTFDQIVLFEKNGFDISFKKNIFWLITKFDSTAKLSKIQF